MFSFHIPHPLFIYISLASSIFYNILSVASGVLYSLASIRTSASTLRHSDLLACRHSFPLLKSLNYSNLLLNLNSVVILFSCFSFSPNYSQLTTCFTSYHYVSFKFILSSFSLLYCYLCNFFLLQILSHLWSKFSQKSINFYVLRAIIPVSSAKDVRFPFSIVP